MIGTTHVAQVELCSQGCGRPYAETVVTVNGWVIDLCRECAVEQCDPISAVSS